MPTLAGLKRKAAMSLVEERDRRTKGQRGDVSEKCGFPQPHSRMELDQENVQEVVNSQSEDAEWNGISDSEDEEGFGEDEKSDGRDDGDNSTNIEDKVEAENEDRDIKSKLEEGHKNVYKDQNSRRPSAKPGAIHVEDHLLQAPESGAALDPALLPAGPTRCTGAWNGEKNRSKRYNSLKHQSKREKRHRLICAIMRLWPGVPFSKWIPERQRPEGLPQSPYDWSSDILKELLELALLTDKDVNIAQRLLYNAPKWSTNEQDEAGGKGMRVGSKDIHVAWRRKIARDAMKQMREEMERRAIQARAQEEEEVRAQEEEKARVQEEEEEARLKSLRDQKVDGMEQLLRKPLRHLSIEAQRRHTVW